MQVLIVQSRQFHNCWSVYDAKADHRPPIAFFIDKMKYNGAFAADSCVQLCVKDGHEIVGIMPQEDRRLTRDGDTNMDAIEGALYRVAAGCLNA